MSPENEILSARILVVEIDGIVHIRSRMRKRNIHRFEILEFGDHLVSVFHDESHGLADIFSVSPDFSEERI